MKSWKTPKDYIEEYIQWHCSSDTRESVGCTEKFYELGFFDMSRGGWDLYAEYQTLCKTCPHYTHDISLYFGIGKYTDNISESDTVWCRYKISKKSEFEDLLSVIPKEIKAISFADFRLETLAGLEAFPNLECVLIDYAPKLLHFWDFTKTPKLKVLEYVSNTRLTNLNEISEAKSLEYFGISTLMSRLDKLSYVDSFYPLTKLPNLKELSLECAMCSDGNIDNLINIPNLEKLWISPHTFETTQFAKFEALKFKIYDEYGIYKNGDDYVRPLGKGGRLFRSEKSKAQFEEEYRSLMLKFKTQ